MDKSVESSESLEQLRHENAVLAEEVLTLKTKLNEIEAQNSTLIEENKLLKMQAERNINQVDKICQTDMQDMNDDENKAHDPDSTEDIEVLTAESIADAAKSAVNNTGWIYDESIGAYFDYNTSLYYYPSTRLYYNYKNGCYYTFNQDTHQYEFNHQHKFFKAAREKEQESENETYKNGLASSEDTCMPSLTKLDCGKWNSKKSYRRVQHSPVLRMSLGHDGKNQDKASNAKVIQETVSDSELECMNTSHHPYSICGGCRNIITSSCCWRKNKLGGNEVGSSPRRRSTKLLRGKAKFSLGRRLKSRSLMKKFLIHCLHEENAASLSDSECDYLSINKSKLIICCDHGNVVNSICCHKRIDLIGQIQVMKRRKRKTSGYDVIANKMAKEDVSLSKDQASANNEDSASEAVNLTNEPVPYNTKLTLKESFAQNDSNLDEEINMIPCIRAMVTSSHILEVGTLFIITCVGAVIGSSDGCDVHIEEDNVSEKHANISYNHEQKHYFVTDLGSHIGTTLNGVKTVMPDHETIIKSPVTHKSVLVIGSTTLVLHLHYGYETCDDCEPGQIQAMVGRQLKGEHVEVMTKKEKEKYRRLELKNIKKKFNLHKEQYQQKAQHLGPQYVDRADERRRTKGSDNPYEKDEMPTSVNTELASHNKGHQMLQKMGWSKGQGLGKEKKGITEPLVPQGTGKGKLGLGFGHSHTK